jgi:hypothetical protein
MGGICMMIIIMMSLARTAMLRVMAKNTHTHTRTRTHTRMCVCMWGRRAL